MADLFANLGLGFATALAPVNVLLCLAGALVGMLVGVLPGLGPVATIAMLLPVTFHLEPVGALIMLAGVYCGAQYGGSTTAILVDMPGEASAAVATPDGHRMARCGRAGAALGAAALASFAAGCLATLVIALAGPPLARVAQAFGPPDYVALMLFGLVASAVIAAGPVVKAIAMIFVGLLLGLVGADIETGAERFTLGIPQLHGGIPFTALAVGLYGVAGILGNLSHPGTRMVPTERITGLLPSREDLRKGTPSAARGTLVGSALGILPGNGVVLAPFATHALEKAIARDPHEFGKGAVQGVAGPEAANNAAAQTSFIPLLTLGIPPNAAMAMMAGVMTIHGIVPGPQVMTGNPALFWGLIASMFVGNLLLVVVNLPLIRLWVPLLRVPYRMLFPVIVVFCGIGAYSVAGSHVDVLLIAAFGLLGHLLERLGFARTPLLIAFVLGRPMEENLRSGLLAGGGDWMLFVERPISLGFILAAVALLAVLALPSVRRARKKAFAETRLREEPIPGRPSSCVS